MWQPPNPPPRGLEIAVPAPPEDPELLRPLKYVWDKDRVITSVKRYPVVNSSAPRSAISVGRFHPFTPINSKKPIRVLYGASDLAGALSETVFHDVPVRGVKFVPRALLQERYKETLAPTRDLRLADLTSDGLSRLGLSRLELIESGPLYYPETALWARCIHAHSMKFDGLIWVSRQRDTGLAVVLFSDRVNPKDILKDDQVGLPLGVGAGLDSVCELADRMGITIGGLAD
jgi:hypothetical protein